MAILQLENVSKSYQTSEDSPPRIVLKDIDLRVFSGDSIAVTGPSGSGKSTLLNIMGSMDKSDTGKVIFKGKELNGLKADELSRIRNRHLGFIFQQHHLLPQLNLEENVLLPLLEEKDRQLRAKAKRKAEELIDWVALGEVAQQFPWQLSGGELQRAAVVRALINDPDLILADEPTGSLDEENAHLLVDLLLKINQEKNIAVVMVTHSAALASKMKDHYKISRASLIKQD